MLARNFRFRLHNLCGQTLAQNSCTVQARYWTFTNGVLIHNDNEIQAYIMDAASLTNNSLDAGDTINNSISKYIGGDFEFTVTAPTSASGSVVLYYETSTDNGTTWPDAGAGIPVASLQFTVAATKIIGFSL